MQHNDFENYLRDQADKFWLEPDPGSFGRVMEAMQREKKRRRFLFILFFSLFGLSVCSGLLWWLTGKPSSAIEMGQADKPAIENKELLTGNPSGNYHSDPVSAEGEPSGINSLPDDLETGSVSENTTGTHASTAHREKESSHVKTDVSDIGTKSSNRKKKSKDSDSPQSAVTDKTSVHTTHSGEDKTLVLTAEKEKETPLTTNTEKSSVATDSSAQQVVSTSETTTHEISATEPSVTVTDTLMVKAKSRFLDPNRTKKWFVSAWFTGFAARSFYNSIEPANPYDTLGIVYSNYRNYADVFRFGFSAGVSVGFTPIKYLTIELGLQYTEFTSLEKPVGYPNLPFDSQAPADPFPFFVSTINEGQVYTSNFKTLQIPLLFTFNWSWGKSAIHVSAGPTFSYTTAFKGYEVSNAYNELVFNTQADSSRVQRFGIGLQSKLLYSYQILPNFSLYAGPTFQYRFNSVFDNAYMIRQHPYFIGLETGLRVHF